MSEGLWVIYHLVKILKPAFTDFERQLVDLLFDSTLDLYRLL